MERIRQPSIIKASALTAVSALALSACGSFIEYDNHIASCDDSTPETARPVTYETVQELAEVHMSNTQAQILGNQASSEDSAVRLVGDGVIACRSQGNQLYLTDTGQELFEKQPPSGGN